jgi:hypothetical protein
MFIVLLACGCASKVQIKGVEIKTLMNGKTVYLANTDCGDREVTRQVYSGLVYKLNNLSAGKTLICDMERGLTGVYDVAICFLGVLAVSEIDTGQDAQEWGE